MRGIPGLLVQSDPGRKEMASYANVTTEWSVKGSLKRGGVEETNKIIVEQQGRIHKGEL